MSNIGRLIHWKRLNIFVEILLFNMYLANKLSLLAFRNECVFAGGKHEALSDTSQR